MEIILIIGISTFFIMLLLHIILWNIIYIKGEMIALFNLFIVTPLILILFGIKINLFQVDLDNLILILILYYSLALVYIQTYPAIVTQIPTFKILLLIKKNNNCITFEELELSFNQEELINSRINLLKQDKLILIRDHKVELNIIGKILSNVFYYYRKFLGLKVGDG